MSKSQAVADVQSPRFLLPHIEVTQQAVYMRFSACTLHWIKCFATDVHTAAITERMSPGACRLSFRVSVLKSELCHRHPQDLTGCQCWIL